MTDEQSSPLLGTLTDTQKARVDYARRDLDAARAEDLAQLSPDGLILLIERLRTRLDDALAILEEVAHPNRRT
jgi:hypothetical protein